jgi:aminoglycoside phosphotransferase (APT) family kinase protein
VTGTTLHSNEVAVTSELVTALLAAQMPDLARRTPVRLGGGTDNVLFRLGPHHVARFPRTKAAVALLAREKAATDHLAACLPLTVPRITGLGSPGQGYPFPWAVLSWIDGHDCGEAPPYDDVAAAHALAGFVAALSAAPIPPEAPQMGAGGYLITRDPFTRKMIAALHDEADPARVTRIWDDCLALPRWTGTPVWTHADLHPLNILTSTGRITAVIDWGLASVGDAAHDMICAWAVLGPRGREVFRARLNPVPDVWARGRALAFSKAIQAVPYYRTSNLPFCRVMRRTLNQTMEDWPV